VEADASPLALARPRITFLVTPSRFASGALASAFALSAQDRAEKILELGYPRNDSLFGLNAEQVAVIRERLGIPEGKRVVLYAPTWRDDQHSSALGYTLQLPVDFERLKSELGSDHVILFRTHYLICDDFDFERYGGFVIDVSDVNDVNDLYAVSDVLVTDYSSVFFDYATMDRPIVFYMYDLDEYANNMRGFYIDLADLPGPIVRTDDELAQAVRSAGTPNAVMADRYHRFNERFTYLDDGHASERVIQRVIRR
jgi:CDP-glycerol glycerophosphotransferase